MGSDRVKFGLKMKFTLMISLMIILVGASLAWYSNKTSREVLGDELLARGRSLAANLAFNSKFGVLSEDLAALRNLLEGVVTEESVEYGRVYEAQGRLLIEVYEEGEEYHQEDRGSEHLNMTPLPKETVVRYFTPAASEKAEEHYEIVAPIRLHKTMTQGVDETLVQIFGLEQEQQSDVPIGFVEIGISPKQMYKKLNRLVWFNIVLTLGVVGMGIIFSWGFVRTLLRPVKGMIETAQEIAQGNLNQRVRVLSGDEMGDLARIFNRMTHSLQERDEELRRQYGELQLSHTNLRQVAAELEEYKKELELKVQERTQELARKNVLLQNAMEKAQESDRLKSQFLANMSHELRTPLNAIIGFAQVMLEGIDGEVSDLQRKDLTAIYSSGIHLLEMINDILDIAKIEAGRMELNIEAVHLEEVIQGVLATAKALVKGKEIQLRAEVPQGLPVVRADRMRVRQVILNLVSNAAKFTAQGLITVSAAADQHSVKVSVNDTGIGIREGAIQNLFQEFTQLDTSTTKNYGGTGLGLALVKRFVELHKGRVWAESQLGVGSTFYFTLPLPQPVRDLTAQTAKTTERPADRARTNGPVIAVIEDDPLMISLFERYLSSGGYRAQDVIPDGNVLERIKDLQPHAILLDILMPHQDGWTILQELKGDPRTRHIPVIICSVLPKDKKGYAVGAVDYLTKPVDKATLLKALARLGKIGEVAVIDDDPNAVRIVERALSDQQYRILTAYDGSSGLTLIKQKKPGLVLLDSMMPGMDGFDVVEAVRKDPEICHTPIVILTAKDLTEEDRTRLNGKVATLIQKSAESEADFMAAVAEVVKTLEC